MTSPKNKFLKPKIYYSPDMKRWTLRYYVDGEMRFVTALTPDEMRIRASYCLKINERATNKERRDIALGYPSGGAAPRGVLCLPSRGDNVLDPSLANDPARESQ